MEQEISIVKNNNFDIQTLMNIVGQNAVAVQNIVAAVDHVSTQIADVKSDISSLDNRMFQIENNEEITSKQVTEIKNAAAARCYELIDSDDDYEKRKYFSPFIRTLYSYIKKNAGCGHKIECTQKGDFQNVMDHIQKWKPIGGVNALKEKIDNDAKTNKRLREEGYDC